MFGKLCSVLVFGAIVTCVGGCPFMGLAYEDDLVGGYAVWATDAIEDAAIVKKNKGSSLASQVIPPTVFAYGCDKDFIIVKRHPPSDAATTYWYVLVVSSGKVHGPFEKSGFDGIRAKLGVAPGLSFQKTVR